MRLLNWVPAEAAAVLDILENPFAERHYERLGAMYSALGMGENSEVVKFLVGERFGGNLAHDPDARSEQRGHGGEDAAVS